VTPDLPSSVPDFISSNQQASLPSWSSVSSPSSSSDAASVPAPRHFTRSQLIPISIPDLHLLPPSLSVLGTDRPEVFSTVKLRGTETKVHHTAMSSKEKVWGTDLRSRLSTIPSTPTLTPRR